MSTSQLLFTIPCLNDAGQASNHIVVRQVDDKTVVIKVPAKCYRAYTLTQAKIKSMLPEGVEEVIVCKSLR